MRSLATGAVALATGLLMATPAVAQSEAPAGNNGSIKVDDILLDDGNESVPHPGCTFVVDFFGYDVGTRTASMVFEGQDPTGGGALLVEDFTFDVATRESGNELNVSRTVDLSTALAGVGPQAKQGWHVKLTVHVDGSQGSDAKHKVFWVSECADSGLVASQAAVDLEHDTALWLAAAQANTVTAPAAAPAELPRTGTHTGQLALFAAALVVFGTFLVRVGARPTI